MNSIWFQILSHLYGSKTAQNSLEIMNNWANHTLLAQTKVDIMPSLVTETEYSEVATFVIESSYETSEAERI